MHANPILAVQGFCDFAIHVYLQCMASFLRPKSNDQSVNVPRGAPDTPPAGDGGIPLLGIPPFGGHPSIREARRGCDAGGQPDRPAPVEGQVDRGAAPGQIHETGTMARILRVVRGDDGAMQVVVQGLERFRVQHWIAPEQYGVPPKEHSHTCAPGSSTRRKRWKRAWRSRPSWRA